jgi:hypothetical protein
MWPRIFNTAVQRKRATVRSENGLNVGRAIKRGVVGSSGAGSNVLVDLLVEEVA